MAKIRVQASCRDRPREKGVCVPEILAPHAPDPEWNVHDTAPISLVIREDQERLSGDLQKL